MKLKFRNLFIAFIFAVLLIGTTAHATSYPIVLPKGFDIIENAGNTVSIGYSYWGQYQNERLELHIYDNSGKRCIPLTNHFRHTMIPACRMSPFFGTQKDWLQENTPQSCTNSSTAILAGEKLRQLKKPILH